MRRRAWTLPLLLGALACDADPTEYSPDEAMSNEDTPNDPHHPTPHEPSEEPNEPSDEPSDEPNEPSDEPNEPSEEPSEPSEEPSEPSEEPNEPSEEPSEPNEEPAPDFVNECPRAWAEGGLQDSGAPLSQRIEAAPWQDVGLSAAGSSDPNEAQGDRVARYEWALLEQPAGSTTRFSPRPSAANPKLFLDLAGRYVVELRVYDAQGLASCEASQVVIEATPRDELYIELTWDTDASDMDLHLLHPNGTWDEAPWDMHYFNREPDWGQPGPSDDPQLDIDDVDGFGPEVATLNQPEPVAYRVAPYYFSDHGTGPTQARLRVFVRGALAWEGQKPISDRQRWEAVSVQWGEAPSVTTLDLLIPPPP